MKIEGGALSSVTEAALYAGANACAVLTPTGQWEVIQFLTATLTAPSTYALTGLLRAQQGTDPAMVETPAGAAFVLLTTDLARLNVALSERGLPLIWTAAPSGAPPSGLASSSQTFAWQGSAIAVLALPSHQDRACGRNAPVRLDPPRAHRRRQLRYRTAPV